MEFRWVALIALWTLLSGPIMGVRSGSSLKPAKAAVNEVKSWVRIPIRTR